MKKLTKIATIVGSLLFAMLYINTASADVNPFAQVDQVQTIVGEDGKCGEGKDKKCAKVKTKNAAKVKTKNAAKANAAIRKVRKKVNAAKVNAAIKKVRRKKANVAKVNVAVNKRHFDILF